MPRYRVGGLLVDSCAHTHDHGPHQWAASRGGRHCPGHPAPPPDQLGSDTVLAARQLRREQLAVLLSRAARGVLTPAEGPLLRDRARTALDSGEQPSPDCPGETTPPTCACPGDGCRHHCTAHQPGPAAEGSEQ